jgi:2-polyprenyl-3-methyl-5-hydroxy-6-metoxy-1,4-benzoquinol methylase/spore coat polysaccharide biosynthesis predicted glycosyltransferase SpsG/ribosomal protein S27AE
VKILLIPSYEKGRGSGHLSRSLELAAALRSPEREVFLYIPQDKNSFAPEKPAHDLPGYNPDWRITESGLLNYRPGEIDFIVLDRFQTPEEEFIRYRNIAPVIGIDEGGANRENFDFLIDILIPRKINSGRFAAFEYCAPNIADPSLISRKICIDGFQATTEKLRMGKNNLSIKILISFGREDAAGLGPAVARSLSGIKNTDIVLLTESQAAIPGVNVSGLIPDLCNSLSKYDLLITHYGLTAYEALCAGIPVLLASPTAYHKKLAQAAGFLTVTLKSLCSPRRDETRRDGPCRGDPWCYAPPYNFAFRIKIFDENGITQPVVDYCTRLAGKFNLGGSKGGLAETLNKFSPIVNRRCPACGSSRSGKVISRYNDRTYRRCGSCGIIYMDRACPPPVEYGRDYFFEQYEKQYGKTYLADFPNLTVMGKRRLKIINSLFPEPQGRTLLDIGCAYGPFLAAARDEGFSPAGIDPAEDAVDYVRKMNISAVRGFFPGCPIPAPASPKADETLKNPAGSFDAVTLWYGIEHFQNLLPVLAEIRKLLKAEGVLSFSTPSFSGVSGRSSLFRFLEKSPPDHWTVLSPASAKRMLKISGFSVKKIVVTGHHPGRFPVVGKLVEGKKNLLYGILLVISKVFRLGDTFEVYAKKTRTFTLKNQPWIKELT